MKPDKAHVERLSRLIVANVIAELGLDLGDWWREKCAVSIQSTLTAHIQSMMEGSFNGTEKASGGETAGTYRTQNRMD